METLNSGATSFLLMSAALVMLMTPALGLFHGGMVRQKNVLATIMQSFFVLGLRVSDEHEEIGLDVSQHSESGYAW